MVLNYKTFIVRDHICVYERRKKETLLPVNSIHVLHFLMEKTHIKYFKFWLLYIITK